MSVSSVHSIKQAHTIKTSPIPHFTFLKTKDKAYKIEGAEGAVWLMLLMVRATAFGNGNKAKKSLQRATLRPFLSCRNVVALAVLISYGTLLRLRDRDPGTLGVSVGENLNHRNIGILSIISTSLPPEVTNLHEATVSKYATSHNYFWLRSQQQTDIPSIDGKKIHRAPHWNKLLLVRRYLEMFDWVLWLDSDTIIVDQQAKLEQYIDEAGEHVSLIVADYGARVNNGAFLLKNSQWSREFLRLWWEQGEGFYAQDNGPFNHAILLAENLPQYSGECSVRHQARTWYDSCFNSVLDGAGYHVCNRRLPHTWMLGPCEPTGLVPLILWDERQSGYHPNACFKPETGFILHTKTLSNIKGFPTAREFFLETPSLDFIESLNVTDKCTPVKAQSHNKG